MNDFDKVFASDIVDNMEFDTIIGAVEDGELIDTVGQNSLFTESGEDVTDTEDDDDDDEDEKDDVKESVEDIANLDVFDEAAKFSFLPRFKQVPELKKYEKTIADAEDLLNSQGEPTKETGLKLGKLAIRILDIWQNAADVLQVPMLIFIITIPSYLICRAFEYFCKVGEYLLAEQHGEKVIAKLRKCEKEAKDPKVKAKCRDQIEKISKQIKKIKSDDYEESFSFEDEEDYGAFVEDCDSVVGSDVAEDCECSEDHDDDFEDHDDFENDNFDDSDFEDDDIEDNEDYGSNFGLQAFNEKPYCSNCESEIDSPEETDDIDQAMTDDEEGTVQDIRDIEDEPQPYAEDSDIFGEGAEDFENDENMTNDEDLSPDSEGALDDGDDIDSLEEMVNLMV